MELEKCSPKAILSDEVYENIKLVEMFAVDIHDRKQTSSFVRQLSDLYPLVNFGHLKRVKSTGDTIMVLITPTNEQTLERFSEELQSKINVTGLGDISKVHVCACKPITRCQFEDSTKYWPTSFHENKRLEKALKGELFLREELSRIKMLMATAHSVTTDSATQEHLNNGAVIVDPLTNTIVAKGTTDPSHPLKHAVMVAIDNVAVQQGGGAWNTGKSSLLQSCATGSVQAEKAACSVASMDLSKDDDIELPNPKRLKQSTQYLCTGYDLYTILEPCVMCSMALVHCRIRCVFYLKENQRYGGLGSKYKIHLQEGLNHHYDVYHVC